MIVLFSQLFFETRLVLHNECSLSDYTSKDGKFLIFSAENNFFCQFSVNISGKNQNIALDLNTVKTKQTTFHTHIFHMKPVFTMLMESSIHHLR